jgi:sugar phosphate isomerase/epimerase
MQRRTFLKNSALASAATLVGSSILSSCTGGAPSRFVQPGVQLYTLRDLLPARAEEVFAALSEMGYSFVESYATQESVFCGIEEGLFKRLLRKNNLKLSSAHFIFQDFSHDGVDDRDRMIADKVADAGGQWLVNAYMFENDRKTIDDYKRLAAKCNKMGAAISDSNLRFAYHNHDFELTNIDGQNPYDILKNETDRPLVDFELDVYWVHRAGRSIAETVKGAEGRFPLWHWKDVGAAPDFATTQVGMGSLDWDKIKEEALSAGLKHYYVEQDQTNKDPLESVKDSIEFLKKKYY